jgi:uncharacterized membrane protein (UPF0182 family)
VIIIKKQKTLAIIVGVLVVIIAFLGNIVNFAINIQWFKEVGYLSVYFTKLTATLKLMVPVFIVTYIAIWTYYKTLKSSIIRWKKVVEVNKRREKLEGRISVLINIILSFIISFSFASNYWYKILEFANATSFNTVDPLFKKDISFFIFKLPLIESLYQTFVALVAVFMVITVITYITLTVKDQMQNVGKENRFSNFKNFRSGITKFAGKQLAIVSALILFLVSLGYLIKAWNLVYSPRGMVFGASYTDTNVSLRFYQVIAIASLIAAIITFISILTSKAKPVIVSVIVIGLLIFGEGITATVVQRFQVQSNEKTFEEPYIQYNIDNTRKAFNVSNIEEVPFEIKNDLTK